MLKNTLITMYYLQYAEFKNKYHTILSCGHLRKLYIRSIYKLRRKNKSYFTRCFGYIYVLIITVKCLRRKNKK